MATTGRVRMTGSFQPYFFMISLLLIFSYYQTHTHTKAFGKKINALAKEKDCELVGEWKKSLTNHLYWSAVDGDGDLIEAKWLSVDNHIHNKHKKHGKLFPTCRHKTIRKRGRKKKWFKPRKLFEFSSIQYQIKEILLM